MDLLLLISYFWSLLSYPRFNALHTFIVSNGLEVEHVMNTIPGFLLPSCIPVVLRCPSFELRSRDRTRTVGVTLGSP